MKRVAMLSLHTSPLAPLGGRETGGMNVYVREISRELGRRGYAVDIFTRLQDSATPRIQAVSELVRVVNLEAGPRRRCAKEHLRRYVEPFTEEVLRFSERHALSYHLVHGHYWLSGLVGQVLSDTWHVPFVQMFHTLAALKNHVARATGEREPQERDLGERQVMARADRIVAATYAEKAQLSWFYGVPAERVRVIPCGVDTTRFSRAGIAAQPPVRLPGKQNLLFVGRIERIKGLEVLLRALAELTTRRAAEQGGEVASPVHLVLIGGESQAGPGTDSGGRIAEKSRLLRLASCLGIAHQVSFLGPQPQHRLPAYYAAADVVVMPSYYESFGLVALEALACGTPVVASKVGGLPHAIEDGATGYLVPPGNVAQLRARLEKLLDDQRLRRCFGLRGAMAVRKFAWPRIAQQVQATYAELVEGRSAVSREWTVP
ncbi:MAG: glycosyltransferase [Candidatus Tectomicrobia bacterium]|nr:glycosyltransferase [Candidatus Tectomicrobia bacterium]